MSAAESAHVINRLIEGLPRAACDRILKLRKPMDPAIGTLLCETDKRHRYVHFPLTALVPLVTRLGEHAPPNIAPIGNEGMPAAPMVRGVNNARLRGYVR